MTHFSNQRAYEERKKKGKVDKGKAKVMNFDIPYERYSDFGPDDEELEAASSEETARPASDDEDEEAE
jgi:hypothetical protein